MVYKWIIMKMENKLSLNLALCRPSCFCSSASFLLKNCSKTSSFLVVSTNSKQENLTLSNAAIREHLEKKKSSQLLKDSNSSENLKLTNFTSGGRHFFILIILNTGQVYLQINCLTSLLAGI